MLGKNLTAALLGLACCLPLTRADDKPEKARLDVGRDYHHGKLIKEVRVGPEKEAVVCWKLKTGQWVYDLDFDHNRLEELEKAAACLEGQTVRVLGVLERRQFGLYVSAIEPWGRDENQARVELVGQIVCNRTDRGVPPFTLRVGDAVYELFFRESKEVKWEEGFCRMHDGETVRVVGLLRPGWGDGRIWVAPGGLTLHEGGQAGGTILSGPDEARERR